MIESFKMYLKDDVVLTKTDDKLPSTYENKSEIIKEQPTDKEIFPLEEQPITKQDLDDDLNDEPIDDNDYRIKLQADDLSQPYLETHYMYFDQNNVPYKSKEEIRNSNYTIEGVIEKIKDIDFTRESTKKENKLLFNMFLLDDKSMPIKKVYDFKKDVGYVLLIQHKDFTKKAIIYKLHNFDESEQKQFFEAIKPYLNTMKEEIVKDLNKKLYPNVGIDTSTETTKERQKQNNMNTKDSIIFLKEKFKEILKTVENNY